MNYISKVCFARSRVNCGNVKCSSRVCDWNSRGRWGEVQCFSKRTVVCGDDFDSHFRRGSWTVCLPKLKSRYGLIVGLVVASNSDKAGLCVDFNKEGI